MSHPPAPANRSAPAVLCLSVLVMAACGIVYELGVAAVSSYLLGDSVRQFSVTIGLFMAAMGVGSAATRWIPDRSLLFGFVAAEVALAVVGGLSTTLLFFAFPVGGGGLYLPVMYALIGVIGALVGLEIPVVVRVLSGRGGLRRSVADALSFDYLGGLAGSLAFPLLMLPALGLFRTAAAVGLCNAGVAGLTLLAFRREVGRPRLLAAATLLAAGLLVTTIAADAWITRHAEGALYAGRVVVREQSPYQRITVTRDPRTGEHRLYLDGHVQLAAFDEHRYHEALVHPAMAYRPPGTPGSPGAPIAPPPARVLILGGGDGLAAREALRFPGVASITLVDLDPAVTGLARSFPPLAALNAGSLDHPRVRVVHADAFSFVRAAPSAAGFSPWDRVLIDLPDPHNEALAKLYSVEFFRLLRRVLAPGGALCVQSGSPWFTPRVFGCTGQTLAAAGFETVPFGVTVPAFGPWGFHLATPPPEPPEAPEAPSASPPAEASFAWLPDARFLTAGTFASARVFPPDVTPRSPGVNSLFDPILYTLYASDVRRARP